MTDFDPFPRCTQCGYVIAKCRRTGRCREPVPLGGPAAAAARIYRSRPCETCGAQPGESCQPSDGHPSRFHAARRQSA
jgi:hypothetical protein